MKRKFLSYCAAAALAVSFTACGNSGTTSANADSSSNSTTTSSSTAATTTPTTSTTSEGKYAAMADTVERNSQQGYYLNPKTGKAYKTLKVDRSTGVITDDAGEPVWRYVDNRNWGVYGGNDWSQIGEAKMQGEKLTYKGDDDKWVDYDNRWMKEDEENIKKWKVSDNGMKQKMTTEDGDKIKIKTDEEGNTKMKVNGEKVKMDKNGNPIKD
jgi:predicted small lipoprotein YifL